MQFDHVALQVPDVAAAVAWWRELVPGTTVLYEDDSWGLIESGGSRVAFVSAEEHPDHLAYAVAGAQRSCSRASTASRSPHIATPAAPSTSTRRAVTASS